MFHQHVIHDIFRHCIDYRGREVSVEVNKNMITMGGYLAYISGISQEGHLGTWRLLSVACSKSTQAFAISNNEALAYSIFLH